MALSDYLENKLLDHALGTSSFTMPVTVYVACFEDDPQDDASGTEITNLGYTREAITFDAAVGGSASNDAIITFGPAGENWSLVTHIALFDASTSGNMLFYGPLSIAQQVNTGGSLAFQIGELTCTLD